MMFSVWLTTFVCLIGAVIEAMSEGGLSGPPPGYKNCDTPMDVSFIIDCSNSIWNLNFKMQIQFVQDIVRQFYVGPDKVHVAAITFAEQAQLQFNYNEFMTTESVVERVGEITQKQGQDMGGKTNTHLALDMMRQSLFASKYARINVPKINILLTDGNVTDSCATSTLAKLAIDAGVKLIVIGIGKDLNIAQINAMASPPADENVYIRGTFDDLHDVDFIKEFGEKFCKVIKKCRVPLDVAFLIDGSMSINEDDFKTQIKFVKSLVNLLDIGPDATHVAALMFSNVTRPQFYFNEFTSQNDVLSKVGSIKQDKGDQTLTNKALEVMRMKLFSHSNGARDSVKHVCIILTDGNATYQEETLEEAARTRADGILVLGIGIGQYLNREELLGMVSPPADKNTFFKNKFDELYSSEFQELVSRQACPAPAPPAPTQADITPDKECEGREADVVFIVDRSSSVYVLNFNQSLVFLKNVVDMLDIGADKTKVAMISYSNTSKVEFLLNTYNSKADIKTAISAVKTWGGNTLTHLALQSLLDDVLVPYNGARPGVTTICILITDGVSRVRHKTLAMAESVRDRGVKLFVIGVGDKTNTEELHAMASKPDAYYAYEVNGYDALGPLRDTLAYKSCALSLRT